MFPDLTRGGSPSSESSREKYDGSNDELLRQSEDSDSEIGSLRVISGSATRWPWALTALNLLIFFLSAVSLSYGVSKSRLSEHERLKQTSFFSPVWDKIDLTTSVKETDGSLLSDPNPSPYRNALAPDPAVNAAWEAMEDIRTFPITREDVIKLGKDPETTVKYPLSYGLGPEAYMAQLDVFHQIHCLNLLRHLAWSTYGRNESLHQKKPYSNVHWIHVSHCTEILMQNLMCTGNLDVVTFNWVETQTLPFPDFFVNHQCRDFDAIVEWQEENALPLDMGRNVSRPADAKQLPIDDAYYELFGLEKVELHERGLREREEMKID